LELFLNFLRLSPMSGLRHKGRSVRVCTDPSDFKRCLAYIERKLERIAARAGVPDDLCADLECTLMALPPFARDRAKIMLEGVYVQTHETYPAMAFAARYVLNLAQEVWEGAAFPVPALAGSGFGTTSEG
jgi:hypothetical protein